jgi:replicative DNA helicase
MPDIQLAKRIISSELKIMAGKLRTGNLSPDEIRLIVDWMESFKKYPLNLIDNYRSTIGEIEKIIREFKIKNENFVVFIDYLQLVRGGTGNTREQEVASISKAFKGIAMQYNIPLMALSQLSRKVDNRGKNAKPVLSDLRESGALEQDADTVIFLHRSDENEFKEFHPIEVIIAKQRYGELRVFELLFNKPFVKFLNKGQEENELFD